MSERSSKKMSTSCIILKKVDKSRTYATGEKELMAIVFAMGHFKVYLYGREFIVRTDHRPLQWFNNLPSPSTRLARWLLMVRQFEFKIEFVSGISNAAAYALSRFFIYGDKEEDESEPGILLNNVSLIQPVEVTQDEDLMTLKKWIVSRTKPEKLIEGNSAELNCYHRHFDKFKLISGNVYREFRNKHGESFFQYVVAKEKRSEVIELLQDSVWAGHLVRDKTLEKFQSRYYWPRSYTEVDNHVKACNTCQKVKQSQENTQPLQPIRTSEPFELVTIDTISREYLRSDTESKSGNKYVMVMICHNSKYADINRMKTQSAKEVVKYVFNLICRHSCTERILTDHGKCFEAELFQELLSFCNHQECVCNTE